MKALKTLIPLFFALIFSACTIQINTQILEDGSGITASEIGFTDEEISMMSELGETPESFCASMEEDSNFPQGVAPRIETRSDGTWCIVTEPFGSLSELQTFYGAGEGITINRLEFAGDTFYYDLSVDMTAEETAQFEGAGVDFDFNWSVTMPGTIQSHNADRVDGATLTWDLTPGVIRTIQAQSTIGGSAPLDFGGGGFSPRIGTAELIIILLCCLCVIVLAGGGIAGFILWRRKQNQA